MLSKLYIDHIIHSQWKNKLTLAMYILLLCIVLHRTCAWNLYKSLLYRECTVLHRTFVWDLYAELTFYGIFKLYTFIKSYLDLELGQSCSAMKGGSRSLEEITKLEKLRSCKERQCIECIIDYWGSLADDIMIISDFPT